MHHIYTTPGFVVHSRPYGEAGKFMLVFSKELGMIGATAQGVRLQKSKLRYHIQDYSYELFSFVKGKDIWRLTGAKNLVESERSFAFEEGKKLYIRILGLLKRLLPGEEKNERLFGLIDSLYDFLCNEKLNEIEINSLEYLSVLRMLDCLGYVSGNENLKAFLEDNVFNKDILGEIHKVRNVAVMEINRALKESQL